MMAPLAFGHCPTCGKVIHTIDKDNQWPQVVVTGDVGDYEIKVVPNTITVGPCGHKFGSNVYDKGVMSYGDPIATADWDSAKMTMSHAGNQINVEIAVPVSQPLTKIEISIAKQQIADAYGVDSALLGGVAWGGVAISPTAHDPVAQVKTFEGLDALKLDALKGSSWFAGITDLPITASAIYKQYADAFQKRLIAAINPLSTTLSPMAELNQLIPNLATQVTCPLGGDDANMTTNVSGCYQPNSIAKMVIHLNDGHEWSRESIADWLESLDIDLTLQPASIGD